MTISIVAAIGKNRELGKDNKLLWHLPEDFKRFKELTNGHVVIMGRKTYESLPEKFRPLPNRINIVISSRSNESNNTNLVWVNSLEAAIEKAKIIDSTSLKSRIQNLGSENIIFIIGGASIYEQAIKYADKLYLTLVDRAYPQADTFFPEYGTFKVEVEVGRGEEEGMKYKFVELTK